MMKGGPGKNQNGKESENSREAKKGQKQLVFSIFWRELWEFSLDFLAGSVFHLLVSKVISGSRCAAQGYGALEKYSLYKKSAQGQRWISGIQLKDRKVYREIESELN